MSPRTTVSAATCRTGYACPEPLESRVLLSGGASNLFARTASGDVNGDGRVDIVIGATGRGAGSTPVVLLDAGDGTFTAPQPITVPAGAGSAVSLADVTGDGILDLIVSGSRRGAAGATNPRSPLRLIGVGNGSFGPAATLNVPRLPGASYVFGIGDFDNDNDPDVVVEGGKIPPAQVTPATRGGKQLLLLANSGNGTFEAPATIPVPVRQVVGLTSGNFGSTTGDDLVIAGRGGTGGGLGQGLTIVRNLASITSATTISIGEQFGLITDAAAGDFDNDTRTDLVVASKGGANRGGGLTLLRGNGDGTFAPGTQIAAAPRGTGTVDAADFNVDDNFDLLTGSAKARGRGGFVSTLATILNTGGATFQNPTRITVAGT